MITAIIPLKRNSIRVPNKNFNLTWSDSISWPVLTRLRMTNPAPKPANNPITALAILIKCLSEIFLIVLQQ